MQEMEGRGAGSLYAMPEILSTSMGRKWIHSPTHMFWILRVTNESHAHLRRPTTYRVARPRFFSCYRLTHRSRLFLRGPQATYLLLIRYLMDEHCGKSEPRV